jgi:hypothetical protein
LPTVSSSVNLHVSGTHRCSPLVYLHLKRSLFLLLLIKGQFFPRTKILFQSGFFFSYKNVASKSFYKSKIQPFPLMLMQRNEM